MYGNFSAMQISASGLAAERMRMDVTANNIANANTTSTENGEPYRRQSVVFAATQNELAGGLGSAPGMSGVEVIGTQSDQTEFPIIYNPGHPHADENGMVRLSNVKIPNEMVDLITASRSYEANLKAITLFKDMIEQSLSMLQATR